MDYEKKYKDAQKWIESIYTELNHERQMEAEAFFPELKESEDDRIRKELIEFLQLPHSRFVGEFGKREQEKYIAWLEEQGEQKQVPITDEWIENYWQHEKVNNPYSYDKGDEIQFDHQGFVRFCKKYCQKPTDKTEPKFKVGDFIVNDYCVGRIVDITKDAYLLDTKQGIPFYCNSTRLYDITKDAKDGDVLVSAGVIFIFNKIHSVWINCHCSLHKDESFIDEDYNLMHIKYSKEVYPATKEQRDLLFQKMKEAGYEWDAKKKELKKIEKKSVEESKGNNGKTSSNWSEEDVNMCESVIDVLVNNTMSGSKGREVYSEEIEWLKSLKEKLTETKGGEI